MKGEKMKNIKFKKCFILIFLFSFHFVNGSQVGKDYDEYFWTGNGFL